MKREFQYLNIIGPAALEEEDAQRVYFEIIELNVNSFLMDYIKTLNKTVYRTCGRNGNRLQHGQNLPNGQPDAVRPPSRSR